MQPSWASTQQTGTAYDKITHIFGVLVSMMPAGKFKDLNSHVATEGMRIPTSPKANWGLWNHQGGLAAGSKTRTGPSINHGQIQSYVNMKAKLAKRLWWKPKGSVGQEAQKGPKQTAVPKWAKPCYVASKKSGGHYVDGKWTSRNRGVKRTGCSANKKL